MQYNRHNHQFTSEKLGKNQSYFHCMNMIIHKLSRWYTTSKYTKWLTLFIWTWSAPVLVLSVRYSLTESFHEENNLFVEDVTITVGCRSSDDDIY